MNISPPNDEMKGRRERRKVIAVQKYAKLHATVSDDDALVSHKHSLIQLIFMRLTT
jgi:hypothetical protein